MTGSLRKRLLGWLLLATAALGILALVDTWDEAVDVATGLSDRVLAGSALAIAERVTADEDQSLVVDIPYSALEMLSSTAQDRVFYRVDGPNGLLTGYDTLTPAATGDEGIGYADGSFAGDPIRVITLARSLSTGIGAIPFRVTVAESTLARRDLAQTLLLRSALRLAAMICGAALIVWITVPLALRPLRRLGVAIAARSPDDLSPLPDDVPQEVQGLVEAVNSLMTRLDIALRALRNFTGNASHQLRTPLAVVRTELALAHRAASPDRLHQALDRADSALAHAERVLAQLLLLARVDAAAGQAFGQELDLAALARDVTSEHIPRAAAAGIDLGFQPPDLPTSAGPGITPPDTSPPAPGPQTAGLQAAAPPLRTPPPAGAQMPAAQPLALTIRAEPVLLAEALSNLIDNAILHTRPGTVVTVSVFGRDDQAILSVEDDGPGIPADLHSLTGRFARGGSGEGLGLGLSVVSEIAALSGGSFRLTRPTSGQGLCAELSLPLAIIRA